MEQTLPNAQLIAQMFLERYYKVLAAMPAALSRFYNEQSTLSIHIVESSGSTHTEQATGLNAIGEKVMATIQGAAATTTFVDAQHSSGGGVLLQVCGSMKKQGLDCKFTQSFFLAPQEKGFFVLNDILRVSPAEGIPTYAAFAAPAPENGMAAHAQPVPQAVPQAVHAPAHQVPAAPTPVAEAPEEQPAAARGVAEAPAAPQGHDLVVPQPSNLATPIRPVAPPASASMTYAQRLKSAAEPGMSPVAAPLSPAVATEAAPEQPRQPESNGGGHAPRDAPRDRRPAPMESTVYGVFCRGFPLDAEVTVDMLEAEFSKFGAMLGGRQGISVTLPKFGGNKTASIKFEQLAAMDAALQADITVGGKKLQLTRLRPDAASGGGAPSGRSGGRGGGGGGGGGSGMRFGAFRGGERGSGRGDGGGRGERLDRGGERQQDRPPRTERPDGPRGDRPPQGAAYGGGGGGGGGDREKRGNGSRRGNRSGSSSRSQTKDDAPIS